MTLTQHTVEPTTRATIDEQTDRWRSVVRDRLTNVDLRPTGRCERPAAARYLDLGDLLITDWESPSAEGVRTSRMAASEPEALVLLSVLSGRQVIESPGETAIMFPGDVLILSSRVAGKMVVPETIKKRTVRIPIAALTPFDTGPRIPDCLVLDAAQNPLANLAHDYLASLGRQFDDMSPVEVEGARNALLVLTAGMIRATQAPDIGETDFLPLLRQQLEAWIVDHLHSGAIRVRDLAAAHNVASRTVHRAFAATGDTVGSVVRAHRIAAARADLVHTTSTIATIAHRWGFCDASHLGREFRRVYSMSPGDYREAYSVA